MKKRDKTHMSEPKPTERSSVLRDKLHEMDAKLAAIVESSDDAIIGKDLTGIITFWNKGAERIYGYMAEEVVGRSVSMLVPSGLTDEVAQILEKIQRGKTLEHFETIRVRKDGRHLNMSLTISPVKDPSGEIVGSSTIGRDISQRIKDEEIIRRQAQILSQIRDAVITTDLDGIITSWNSGAARMFSHTEEEALGKHISLIYPENQLMFLEHDIIAPLKEKGEHESEVLLRRKSGETFSAILFLTLMKNGNGDVTGMIGSSVDISARKKAEERIKLAKEEWEQMFDALPDIVAVIDSQHVIRKANKALSAKLGINRHELIGKMCYNTMCGLKTPHSSCPCSMAILTGKEQVEERFVERLQGHYFISCTPIVAGDGSITSSVEVCRDISARKKLEHKLQEASITDELTGLLNRRGFLAAAEHQLHMAIREKRNIALFYLDLNDMKQINDRFSHKEGDLALVDTANLLRKTFRESDIIARLGGDEFAVVLADPSETDVKLIITEHLQLNVAAHNAQSGRPYELSISIGVAYYDSEQRCSLDELMVKADALMYRQKQQYKHDREIEALIEEGKKKKRFSDRLAVDDRWWTEIEGVGRCEIRNISAKGVCVEAVRALDVGSRRRITIHSPHRDVSHEVVVIWCRLAGSTNKDGVPYYEFGLSIVSLKESATR